MELSVLNIVVYVILGITTFTGVIAWLYQKGVNKGLQKAADGSEKIGQLLEGGAVALKAAGFEKIAVIPDELGDVFDEAGDPLQILADAIKNKEFTKETLESLIKEGKEVYLEGKDCFVKVFRKD